MRARVLEQLAHDLHREPYQLMYRRKPVGQPVAGWSERLLAYHWPTPELDYAATADLLAPWFNEAGALSRRLLERNAWTSAERTRAAELAWEVLKWGGVTRQAAYSEHTVERVFRKALWLAPTDQPPMNSGWTKVAALATAFLEDEPDGLPHVIWDSRVSTALVSRLEPLLIAAGETDPKRLFPDIGTSPGRGGTRPRTFKLRWARTYRSWRGQEAGTLLVRELRDLLNRDHPPMPLPHGEARPWTMRGVESVLFMDGY